MAKDKRLYARFDIGFDEHDKVYPLSDAAFRALVEATLYARRQLTDGFLAERLAVKRWGVDVLDELSTNDPEKPSLVRVEGGWQIHDFAEHQTTNADIQAKREAGAAGGRAKAKRAAGKGVAGATKVLEQKPGTTLAKSESESESDTETERLLTKSVSLAVTREHKTDGLKAIPRPVDPRRIAELVETVCDVEIYEATAIELSQWIVEHSPDAVTYPHAYTERAIRNDSDKVLQWITERRAA